MKVSPRICLALSLTICTLIVQVSCGLWKRDNPYGDPTPAMVRDVRAEARYHFKKANLAQENMYNAERLGDVDMYETNRNIMRQEDLKMIIAGEKYEEMRDSLEAQIWSGQLEIEGFDKVYEKSTASSILDHLLLKAKH